MFNSRSHVWINVCGDGSNWLAAGYGSPIGYTNFIDVIGSGVSTECLTLVTVVSYNWNKITGNIKLAVICELENNFSKSSEVF